MRSVTLQLRLPSARKPKYSAASRAMARVVFSRVGAMVSLRGGQRSRPSAHHFARDVAALVLVETVSLHPKECRVPKSDKVAFVLDGLFQRPEREHALVLRLGGLELSPIFRDGLIGQVAAVVG